MKIKLLFFTILLLFVTLSSELIALELPKINEVKLVLEKDKSEKEIEKQDLHFQLIFQITSINISSIALSILCLEYYFFVDNTYKPPISNIIS